MSILGLENIGPECTFHHMSSLSLKKTYGQKVTLELANWKNDDSALFGSSFYYITQNLDKLVQDMILYANEYMKHVLFDKPPKVVVVENGKRTEKIQPEYDLFDNVPGTIDNSKDFKLTHIFVTGRKFQQSLDWRYPNFGDKSIFSSNASIYFDTQHDSGRGFEAYILGDKLIGVTTAP